MVHQKGSVKDLYLILSWLCINKKEKLLRSTRKIRGKGFAVKRGVNDLGPHCVIKQTAKTERESTSQKINLESKKS